MKMSFLPLTNSTPRRKLGYRTSEELFESVPECHLCGLTTGHYLPPPAWGVQLVITIFDNDLLTNIFIAC